MIYLCLERSNSRLVLRTSSGQVPSGHGSGSAGQVLYQSIRDFTAVTMEIFRLYLNSVGCCRALPNVAGRSPFDRASTSGLARYTVMEKVLISGRIVQGVLNDYPKTEYSQQPTASTTEHATHYTVSSVHHGPSLTSERRCVRWGLRRSACSARWRHLFV